MSDPISDYSDTRYPFRFIIGEVGDAARDLLAEWGEVSGENGFTPLIFAASRCPTWCVCWCKPTWAFTV